ncbi:MAG: carbonic anhydrase [Hydrococcus sp. C42_A2020_068]|uniref:carbonic anhydrase n=1 Tax=Pleurocapsa sp. PCC 7327 TaxID=118163 RepID=UPI00029F856C|nr:carbonic anhydrase [Pleurocapsa sp. PCC 7327]AFY75993.1 carbonic anhydrase [Pleurocapsa sp. PCC 7327]MBF2021864.1 carbonic anhydrase [Hydrococcus sp. C42_A2020_068]
MKKLLEGLKRFQAGYFSSHKELFEQLAHGQHPRILFITCADSRIDPNLITQAEVGELFVIRNAGNIIPPFGAANGGEGASIEYAIDALGIEQIVVCGHSHCGAMKGLLQLNSLEEKMPLVYNWLKHAEATRRVVNENYSSYLDGEELLELTIAENVLNQLDNLQTYPSIRSKQHQQKLSLHGWIYRIETGEVLAYDPVLHDFVPPQSRLTFPEPEYVLHPSAPLPHYAPFKVPDLSPMPTPETKSETQVPLPASNGNGNSPSGYSHLSPEQAERIYRGSQSKVR